MVDGGRQNPHQVNARSVVREADRIERKASRSTERAAQELAAMDDTIEKVDMMIYTYEETVKAIEECAEEKAQHEAMIQEIEERYEAAKAAEEAAAEEERANLRSKLIEKRLALINCHRRMEAYNTHLHSQDWKN